MNTKGIFSSKTILWETPKELFDKLNREYNFTLDVCAIHKNAKCKKYFTPQQNGLKQNWGGHCFMNPPYGGEIGKWIEKAYKESRKINCTVVALLPARTDTRWFHEWIYRMHGVEVEFLKGRLKFGNSTNSAPFPSMVVVFKKHPAPP